ncbi:MAG: BrnT family toxin [Hyphomicrobiales bacterium]
MRLTFDPAKRDKTLAERGLDFGDAGKAFAHNHLTVADDRRDYGEQRFVTVGCIGTRMVVLVWTPRQGGRRIVSMRKANDREQKIYAPQLA